MNRPATFFALLVAVGSPLCAVAQEPPEVTTPHKAEVGLERYADRILGADLDPQTAQIHLAEKHALSIESRLLPALEDVIATRRWSEGSAHFAAAARVLLPPQVATREGTLPSEAREWDWAPDSGSPAENVDLATAVLRLRQELDAWKSIKYCRGKVAQIQVIETWRRVEAQLKFEVVGRAPSGRMVQVFGRARTELEWDGKRWLVNSLRPIVLRRTEREPGFFSDQTGAAGLSVDFPAAEPWHARRAGIAAGDYDGDGWQDLYVAHVGGGFVFRNRRGGRFEDVTATCGIPRLPAKSCLWLDFDGDGDLDLVLGRFAANPQGPAALSVLRNDRGSWSDVSAEVVPVLHGPVSALVAADFNRDGNLDLFVTTTGTAASDPQDRMNQGTANWVLWGDGRRFTLAEWPGPEAVTRWSHAAAAGDANGDGVPDVYVSNDTGQDGELYASGPKGWTETARAAGVANQSTGMGVTWGDYDGDGDLDLYVTNMTSTAGTRVLNSNPGTEDNPGPGFDLRLIKVGNRLFRNRGQGEFDSVPDGAGAANGQFCWGGEFVDVDNDGWLDLYCVNGYVTGPQAQDV